METYVKRTGRSLQLRDNGPAAAIDGHNSARTQPLIAGEEPHAGRAVPTRPERAAQAPLLAHEVALDGHLRDVDADVAEVPDVHLLEVRPWRPDHHPVAEVDQWRGARKHS